MGLGKVAQDFRGAQKNGNPQDDETTGTMTMITVRTMITTTMMTGEGGRKIIDIMTTTMMMIPPTTIAVGVRVMDATTIMMPIIDTTSMWLDSIL